MLRNLANDLSRRLRVTNETTVAALQQQIELERTRAVMARFVVVLAFLMVTYSFVLKMTTDVLRNFDPTGFNDRASSIRVERGYWMFCTDSNFMGDCRTFGPGDYATLSWLSNRISSGRRISNEYPYNAPPAWR